MSLSSTRSFESNCSELLDKNRRLIFKYPDGSFCYAYKCPEGCKKDKWVQIKGRNATQLIEASHSQDALSNFQVLQIEDEISFIVENMQYLVDPDSVIKNYF